MFDEDQLTAVDHNYSDTEEIRFLNKEELEDILILSYENILPN